MKQRYIQLHTLPPFGYSLVEVLVSIAVLMLAIIGPMTIASQGIKSSEFTLEQNTAFFLAQEGIEAVVALRDNYALKDVDDGLGPADPDTSWDWLSLLPCAVSGLGDSCEFGIDFRDNSIENNITADCDTDITNCLLYFDESGTRGAYTHVGTTPSPYTRVITVSYYTDSAVKITSKVSWNAHVFGGQPQSVTLVSYLYDSI